MTRKDFEAIAHIFRARLELCDQDQWMTIANLANSFAAYAATTNPRFDTGRFMRAAGF